MIFRTRLEREGGDGSCIRWHGGWYEQPIDASLAAHLD